MTPGAAIGCQPQIARGRRPGRATRFSPRDLEEDQLRDFFTLQLHGESVVRQFRAGSLARRMGAILEVDAVGLPGIQPFEPDPLRCGLAGGLEEVDHAFCIRNLGGKLDWGGSELEYTGVVKHLKTTLSMNGN